MICHLQEAEEAAGERQYLIVRGHREVVCEEEQGCHHNACAEQAGWSREVQQLQTHSTYQSEAPIPPLHEAGLD